MSANPLTHAALGSSQLWESLAKFNQPSLHNVTTVAAAVSDLDPFNVQPAMAYTHIEVPVM
jgi:hypothetical protein